MAHQVLCDNESEEVVPRAEIQEIIALTAEDLPSAEDSIAIEQVVPRVQKRPVWMQDYHVTGVKINYETIAHFTLFADCDPYILKVLSKKQNERKQLMLKF